MALTDKQRRRERRRTLVKIGGFALLLWVGMVAFTYYGDAHACAREYVSKSDDIRAAFDEVSDTTLIPLWMAWHSNGLEGKARLDLWISGAKRSGRVEFYLKEELGQWHVERAIVR